MRRPSPNALLVVIFLTFGYLSWRFLKVGAGDIKLLLVVILFLLPYHQTLLFLFNFAISALVLAAIYMARFRTLRIAIPLAPAISGGYFLIIMA
jgi:Flp pilus assembly protein protease CpaA